MKRNVKVEKLFLDILLGRIDTKIGLIKLKNNFSENIIAEKLQKLLKSNNKVSNYLNKNLYPKKYDELFKEIFISNYTLDLNRELIWFTTIIKNNASNINLFLSLKKQYEINLINGHYSEARIFLEKIEKEISISLWTLENKFILEEYSNGLEENKKFLSDINEINCDCWTIYLAYMYSYKAEKNVNNVQYKNRIDKMLEDMPEEIKCYFKFRVLGIENFEYKYACNILVCESMSSVIDIYDTFMKICMTLCSNKDLISTIKNTLKKCFSILSNLINDEKIRNLNIILNDYELKNVTDFDYIMNEISDLYTRGQYEKVITKCDSIINSYSNCFEVYEYFVKSALRIGYNKIEIKNDNETIQSSIIRGMYYSYVRKPNCNEMLIKLQNIIRIFNTNDFGIELTNFYMNRFYIDRINIVSSISKFCSKFYNSRLCITLSDKKLDYLNELQEIFGEGSHIKLFKYFYCNYDEKELSITIEDERVNWYKIKKELIREDESNAIIELEEMYRKLQINNSDFENYRREKIVIALFNIYIYKKDYKQCLKLFIDNYLNNKWMTIRMNGKLLYEKIINNLYGNLKSNIDFCILTHIYNVNTKTAISIYSAYANFLDFYKLEKPTELINIKDEFEKNKLIYFLRYICTTDVIDSTYSVFDSEEKVNNERINICQFLRDIDRDNESVYINEISQLTQKENLLQSIQYLDESKIDLDILKIRNSKKEVFKDNFKRYKEIGNFNAVYKIIDITGKNYLLIDLENKNDNINSQEKKNQKYLAFKEMFLDYRYEFAFGEYGLDTSLGTKIRHGTLENRIRSVFEQYTLVFLKKTYNSTEYVPSDIFDKIFSTIDYDKEFLQKLNNVFVNFTSEVDCQVDEIKEKWITIKTEDKNSEGIIDLEFTDEDIFLFFTDTNSYNNDELVLEYFEKIFIERIEIGLTNMRNMFRNKIKDTYINFLNKLEKEINNLFIISKRDKVYEQIINNIVSCRTRIQNEINDISEWFKLPQIKEYHDFTWNQLIESCEAINRKLYTQYNNINISISSSSNIVFKGYTFSYLIEILIILFTNSIYHSGFMNELNNLSIKIDIQEIDNMIAINFISNISNNIDIKHVSKKIEETEDKIKESQDSKHYYNFEGGSGYVKIAKMLTYNIVARWTMDFGINEDSNKFFTKIVLDKTRIIDNGKRDDSENIINRG